MSNRFIIDDCGTLIDMVTRDMYDYVSEVCPLLNNLYDENEFLKNKLVCVQKEYYDYVTVLGFLKSKGYSLHDVIEYEKRLLE